MPSLRSECRMSTSRGELIRKERSSVALSIHCHRQSTWAGEKGQKSRFGFQTTCR